MNVTITIPDYCELIKDGNTYIVKEKKQEPPRSWREFCKNYPKTTNEHFICYDSSIGQILNTPDLRDAEHDKNICISKEEAKAFLALMQLRQLRKAWVGDWKPLIDANCGIIFPFKGCLITGIRTGSRVLSFPTEAMAKDFLNCFRDLCETAKILL